MLLERVSDALAIAFVVMIGAVVVIFIGDWVDWIFRDKR